MNAVSQLEIACSTTTAAWERRPLHLRCPVCSRDLAALDSMDSSSTATCPDCRFAISNRAGIWRALAPDREDAFRRFVEEYQHVRSIEGRGSSSPGFYLRLPYEDITGRHRWQWKIRGRTFRFFERTILPEIENGRWRGLDVLDLGAGNCWMSYHLALRGHKPVSIDLIDNLEDGLGAAQHYLMCLPNPFVRFQAEMDRVPFQDRQFDLAIFNASFHYSQDYHRTLAEVLRCLRRPAYLVIMDSPFYQCGESGQQMVEEKHAAFTQKFGFPSDGIPSREYVTGEILKELGRAFRLSWHIEKPWYGLGWAWRPVRARLLRQREPSKFFIVWTKVEEQ
jgi:SAM-dependent methyltransferase